VPQTPAGGIAAPGYVGADACTQCHRGIAQKYAKHSMARTGVRALKTLDAKWLARIFDAGATQTIHHEKSGLSYRVRRDGDRYYVDELMFGTDGTVVHRWSQQLTHALSAGSYGLAFYFRKGGHLYQVPLDYYAEIDRWDLDPGVIEGNFRFSLALDTSCIHCHTDPPRSDAGSDSLFYEPLPRGVGCERCHGPGANHVASMKPEDIVNPAKLTPARALDVCVQCHLAKNDMLRSERRFFEYKPGDVLDHHRVNFVSADGAVDRVALLAHPERMVRSACYRESKGKLTCTTCHDPHQSSVDEAPKSWDRKCMSCHATKPCTETVAARAKQNDHCIGCHMQKAHPMNPVQVTITDHWIQRRPAPIRPGREEPAERLVTWSTLLGEPSTQTDTIALHALALAKLGRRDLAEKMVGPAIASNPRVPQLYDWLAAEVFRAQPENALAATTSSLHLSLDSRDALFAYALLNLDRGVEVQAMHALDRLIALDKERAAALETKGLVLFRGGRTTEARPLLERAAAAGPMSAASHVGLALIAMRDDRSTEAIAHLEAARAIAIDDAWILDRLAALYQKTGDAAHLADIERARAFFKAKGHYADGSATRWIPSSWR
jgi:hypothetical protein